MKFLYYLIKADGTVEGTDSSEVAEAASKDGETVIIHVATGTATFDGDESVISAADPEDWLDDDTSDEDDDEGDNE